MRNRRWLLLILTLFIILGIGYSAVMPLWEAPDEHAHYLVAYHIARDGRIPSPEETYEAYQPPLYYWLMSWPLRLLDHLDPDLVTPYFPQSFPEQPTPRWDWTADNFRFIVGPYLVRWLDLLLGVATVYFIYRGAQQFTSQTAVIPAVTAALAGLTPQFVHISASISNDAAANLAGAVLFYLLGLVCSQALNRRSMALAAGAGLLLPALVKLTVLPIATVVLLALVWRTRRSWASHWRWLVAGGLVGVGAVLAFTLVAPTAAENLWLDIVWRAFYVRPEILQPSLGAYRAFAGEIIGRFGWSYWGQVGWVAVGLPKNAWLFMTSFAALGWLSSARFLTPWQAGQSSSRPLSRRIAGIGVLVLALVTTAWLISVSVAAWVLGLWALAAGWLLYEWYGGDERQFVGSRLGWAMVWVIAGLSILMAVKNYLATPHGIQGRFLFPSIGALSLLMAAGWAALLPASWRRYLPHATLALMILLNLILWFDGVIPVYYQPFLD